MSSDPVDQQADDGDFYDKDDDESVGTSSDEPQTTTIKPKPPNVNISAVDDEKQGESVESNDSEHGHEQQNSIIEEYEEDESEEDEDYTPVEEKQTKKKKVQKKAKQETLTPTYELKQFEHPHSERVVLKPLKQDDSHIMAKRAETKALKAKQKRLKQQKAVTPSTKSLFTHGHEEKISLRPIRADTRNKRKTRSAANTPAGITRYGGLTESYTGLSELESKNSRPSSIRSMSSVHSAPGPRNANASHEEIVTIRPLRHDDSKEKMQTQKIKDLHERMKKQKSDASLKRGKSQVWTNAHESSAKKSAIGSKIAAKEEEERMAKIKAQREKTKAIREKLKKEKEMGMKHGPSHTFGSAHEEKGSKSIGSKIARKEQEEKEEMLRKEREKTKKMKEKLKKEKETGARKSTKHLFGNAHEASPSSSAVAKKAAKMQEEEDARIQAQRMKTKMLKEKMALEKEWEMEMGETLVKTGKHHFGNPHEI